MQLRERRKRLTAHPLKHRLRKIIAGISFLVFLSLSVLVPFLGFNFAVFSLQFGYPLFLDLWREQPAMRLILTGILFLFAVGVLNGAFIGAWFWVRSLQILDFPQEQMVWPFGKRRWGQELVLPSHLTFSSQDEGHLRAGTRYFAWFGFTWLGLWAFSGTSLALASFIPLGLWIGGRGDLPPLIWEKAFVPLETGGNYWTMVISIFLGFLTGTPAALLQWLIFLKKTLRLTDDEIQSLLSKRISSRRTG